MYAAQLVFALYLVLPVASHIALWDPAMYGWDPTDINQNDAVTPLADLPFDQWWFHGYINQPPADGVFMNLPSGGTYHGQVACNKAQTTYGASLGTEYACEQIGPLHTTDSFGSTPTDVMGCGLAIAYESDVTKIQPDDFAVISVNYECPWKKDVDFQIPGDLPPCPEGGCHCLWGWVHNSDSGSEQNYILGYRCNVTGATGTQPLPMPKTANKCDYPTDTSNCTVGAKQPHYWYQAERNNNFQGTYDPPFYNGKYGYMNGAQTDLFAGLPFTSTSVSPSTTAAASSTTTLSTGLIATPSTVPASVTTSTTLTSTASTAHIAGHTAVPDDQTSSSVLASTTIVSTASPKSSANSLIHTASASISSSRAITFSANNTSPTTLTSVRPATASSTRNAASVIPSGVANATSTKSPGKTCKRRKRGLERLDDPEILKQHNERQVRRAEKKLLRKAPKAKEVEGVERHKHSRRVVRRHGKTRQVDAEA